MTLNDVISHVRDRAYMSGIERERSRVKSTGEVFTPTPLVHEVLDRIPNATFKDPTKTFLDPACGDGQFLGEVLIRKLTELEKIGIPIDQGLEIALTTIYGVDLMIENVDLCRERLLCGRSDLRNIVERNIVCQDGLKSTYKFGEPTKRQRMNDSTKRKIAANAQKILELADKEDKKKK